MLAFTDIVLALSLQKLNRGQIAPNHGETWGGPVGIIEGRAKLVSCVKNPCGSVYSKRPRCTMHEHEYKNLADRKVP